MMALAARFSAKNPHPMPATRMWTSLMKLSNRAAPRTRPQLRGDARAIARENL